MGVIAKILRSSALKEDQGEALLWFLNREVVPVLREILDFTNRSWGSTVDLTASHTVALGEENFRGDATAGPIVITLLPSEIAVTGPRLLTVKKMNSAGDNVTWLAQGDDDVDGAPTGTLATQYELVRLRPRAGGYDIV